MEQEAQLLVRLAQGVQEGLQAGKVLEQLVHTEDPQHLHQTDDLAGLADDFKVLQLFEYQGSEEGNEANEVHQVQFVHKKSDLVLCYKKNG